jgi:hypothetical protein
MMIFVILLLGIMMIKKTAVINDDNKQLDSLDKNICQDNKECQKRLIEAMTDCA